MLGFWQVLAYCRDILLYERLPSDSNGLGE